MKEPWLEQCWNFTQCLDIFIKMVLKEVRLLSTLIPICWLIALGANWNLAQFKTDRGLDEEQLWFSFSLNEMEKVISNSFSLRFLEKNFRQLKIAWISNHMCESEKKDATVWVFPIFNMSQMKQKDCFLPNYRSSTSIGFKMTLYVIMLSFLPDSVPLCGVSFQHLLSFMSFYLLASISFKIPVHTFGFIT